MTEETGKVYDIAFRMGVLFNILLFTIFNIVSFVIAQNKHLAGRGEIHFPDYGFGWGFPFVWGEQFFVVEGAGTILNVVIWVFCGFFFGFFFKFVWSKIVRRGVKFNGAPSS